MMAADIAFVWDIAKEISKSVDWDEQAVSNTLQLFDDDNTIPFIARYRKSVTKDMTPEVLRDVKSKYDELKAVREKVRKIFKANANSDKMTKSIIKGLACARTPEEVEIFSAPFKAASKRSLAEKARELGLEETANKIIQCQISNEQHVISQHVNAKTAGLSKKEDVFTGLQYLIADKIAKDSATLNRIREMCGQQGSGRFGDIVITITESKMAKSDKKEKSSQVKDVSKFADYVDKTFHIRAIKDYQVCAINRGENNKALSVKFALTNQEREHFIHSLKRTWIRPQHEGCFLTLMTSSIDDAFKRLIEPLVLRHARAELNKQTERARIAVFAANLKRLLLSPPVKGKVVLGVDPGFRHGCKYAMTSVTGSVLATGVAYIHSQNSANVEQERQKLAAIIVRHKCETVAIGNGTACRETEEFFSKCIKDRRFAPLNVQYCIVDESGASIYSASDEAQKELPDLDVTIRGAVSIARRLQDPLAELVKIEPKHIGVGMYQHDCSEKQLKTSLDDVVSECVSFTGVDLNSCSQTLLRKIAGLDAALAQRIVAYREEYGGFVNREQLKSIKQLGVKRFQQCAGFVRVLPQTVRNVDIICTGETADPLLQELSGGKRKAPTETANRKSKVKKRKLDAASFSMNPLDRTCIHPESYAVAERFIEHLGLRRDDVGTSEFVRAVRDWHQRSNKAAVLTRLAEVLCVAEPTLAFIVNSLTQPAEWDFRETFSQPLFRREVARFDDLKIGAVLTGKVQNCVTFGVFVDVGVGASGLLHNSQIKRHLLKSGAPLGVGDRIEVKVLQLEATPRQKIGLALVRVL